MKSIVVLTFLFLAKAAMAAIPLRVSAWKVTSCESEEASAQCVEYSANIVLWRFKDEVCGTINETTERKSPDGWFGGQQYREGTLLRFLDSFQYGKGDYGWARLSVNGNHLQWQVLSSPNGGAIHGEARFQRLPTVDRQFTTGPVSCSELQGRFSGIAVRLQ